MSDPISVDIWSDIACPWCYIGKRRFENARTEFESEAANPPITVRFHSFELAPDTPGDIEGNVAEYLMKHKGMPAEQVTQMFDHVSATARSVGLSIDYDKITHTNTLKAHELVHLARPAGLESDMLERLMSAYFSEGRHVGRIDDLADLAAEVGLDRETALRALSDGEFAADVQADKAQAAELGITGVPFFVFDSAYGVSGAQETGTFRQVLAEVASRRGAHV